MKFIGNIIWLLLGGLITSVMYFLSGLLMCMTIIGIPFGVKLIQVSGVALWPFGSTVKSDPVQGCLVTVFNVLWIVLGWWEIALVHLLFGAILCITIAGIPFGKQHFKLAKYTLFPFGSTIKRGK